MQKPNTLIIGGSSTFGREIAKELLLSGHNLLVSFFSRGNKDDFVELVRLSKKYKKNNLFIERLDIRDELQIKKIVGSSRMRFDNLVYSIGAKIDFKEISKLRQADLEEQFYVYVTGLLLMINQLIQEKHPLKSILVIGSSCLFGTPPSRLSDYTISKYGQFGLVKCLASELASKGIKVNMISPGVSGEGLSSTYPDAFLRLIKSQTPLRRLVNSKDVARLAKFLLSDGAGYITGLNIPVDGGLHTA